MTENLRLVGTSLGTLVSASGVTVANAPAWAQVPIIILLASALVTVCVFLYRGEAKSRKEEAAAREKEAARADRLQEEKEKLLERFIQEMLPVLNASTQSQERSAQLQQQVLERLRGS